MAQVATAVGKGGVLRHEEQPQLTARIPDFWFLTCRLNWLVV